MKNKKILIGILILIILCAIGFAVYKYRSSYLFSEDGSIVDGHQDLINHLEKIENAEEKTKQIDFSLEQNLITVEEANELRK